MASKKWADMTEQEKQAARDNNRRQLAHQAAIKVKEAALDALQSYLKERKRKRPAPTMAFQYIGFDIEEFNKLVAMVQAAEEEQDWTERCWLNRQDGARQEGAA